MLVVWCAGFFVFCIVELRYVLEIVCVILVCASLVVSSSVLRYMFICVICVLRCLLCWDV